jgi:hypothetical protein
LSNYSRDYANILEKRNDYNNLGVWHADCSINNKRETKNKNFPVALLNNGALRHA